MIHKVMKPMNEHVIQGSKCAYEIKCFYLVML